MTTIPAAPGDAKSARTQAKLSARKARGGMPLLLRIGEAAFELGVCNRQIYYWVADGTLELVKLGDKLSRITSQSVRRKAARRSKPVHVANLKNSGAAK
jgi:excisionase family DNA binding protein